jgi:hypothetical protein
MKVEAQEQLCVAGPTTLPSDDSDDYEQATFSVKTSDGCAVSAFMGGDAVHEEVWGRSPVLSRLVQACVENGMNGDGPLPFTRGDMTAWMEFTADSDEECPRLCEILQVCSCDLMCPDAA